MTQLMVWNIDLNLYIIYTFSMIKYKKILNNIGQKLYIYLPITYKYYILI